MANKPKRFKAMLEKGVYVLEWTMARLPFDPHAVWPEMIRLRVRGDVLSGDGGRVAFRTSLFPAADGSGYLLLVNAVAQREAGIRAGSLAEFVLEPDLEARPAELPDVLSVLLDEEDGLREYYDSLSESMRREAGKWIAGVKSEVSQRKRCEQMAERLLAGMEGERDLPPLIAAAFRRRPKAKAGWAKMTLTQRRQHLLGVFYYQTVDARERRVEKLCDEAEKKA
jgi:hypothetical protein